jgi:hypothetical protein
MWHARDRREKCTRFWWEIPKKRVYSEDRDVDEIKMDLREIGWRVLGWIHLAQNRNLWRAVVNTVMKLRVLAPRCYIYIYTHTYIHIHIHVYIYI